MFQNGAKKVIQNGAASRIFMSKFKKLFIAMVHRQLFQSDVKFISKRDQKLFIILAKCSFKVGQLFRREKTISKRGVKHVSF